MDFLDEIYFDNPLKSYLVLLAVIVVAVLVKKYVSRFIAQLCFMAIRGLCGGVDRSVFTNLVIAPLGSFLVAVVTAIAIDRLYYPEVLDFSIYHIPFKQVIESVIIGIIIILFIRFFIRFIDFIALVMKSKAATGADPGEQQLIFFFKDFLKVIVIIVGIILILKFSFHARVGELITGLSIVGAALALAAKESLENLIASFIIFFDKPFMAGDMVRLNNYQGFVETIGLRSTRLRTIDKTLVIVPNKQMVDSILDNFSMRDQIRNEIRVDVSPLVTSEKLDALIASINSILDGEHDRILHHSVFIS